MAVWPKVFLDPCSGTGKVPFFKIGKQHGDVRVKTREFQRYGNSRGIVVRAGRMIDRVVVDYHQEFWSCNLCRRRTDIDAGEFAHGERVEGDVPACGPELRLNIVCRPGVSCAVKYGVAGLA